MLALVKDALQKPRPMSGLALRLDGDEWVSWMPPVSHPCYDEMRVLQIQNSAQHYNQQKELLDKLNQKNGERHLRGVVLHHPGRGDREVVFDILRVGQRLLDLLPQTEKIAFCEKDKAV